MTPPVTISSAVVPVGCVPFLAITEPSFTESPIEFPLPELLKECICETLNPTIARFRLEIVQFSILALEKETEMPSELEDV